MNEPHPLLSHSHAARRIAALVHERAAAGIELGRIVEQTALIIEPSLTAQQTEQLAHWAYAQWARGEELPWVQAGRQARAGWIAYAASALAGVVATAGIVQASEPGAPWIVAAAAILYVGLASQLELLGSVSVRRCARMAHGAVVGVLCAALAWALLERPAGAWGLAAAGVPLGAVCALVTRLWPADRGRAHAAHRAQRALSGLGAMARECAGAARCSQRTFEHAVVAAAFDRATYLYGPLPIGFGLYEYALPDGHWPQWAHEHDVPEALRAPIALAIDNAASLQDCLHAVQQAWDAAGRRSSSSSSIAQAAAGAACGPGGEPLPA